MKQPQIELHLSRKLFNDAYYPFLFAYSNRYDVYYGGSGSGKSHFITQKILIKALKQKRKVLIIRKVARTLKDSVFQLLLDTLKQFQLYERCTINYSTFSITLPNGSQFLFKGIDDEGEKIKSITGITDCWIEEATELFQNDFTQLDLRLRTLEPNPQIFLSFNPTSKVNWVYKHFFENGKPDSCSILKTTYKDNRFLPESYIATLEALQSTNPAYYRIYALGEFASLDKLIYSNYSVEEFDIKQVKGTAIVGLDFGYIADATALIAGKVDEANKVIYIADEHYQTGLLNDAIAKLITDKGYSKEIIIADSAEQKSIEEIKRKGIPRIRPASKGQGSVIHGIQFIQQFKLIVHPKCENTITELQNYAWRKDKHSNEYVNEPIDSFNHCLDALRYAVQIVNQSNKLQTINKAAFGL